MASKKRCLRTDDDGRCPRHGNGSVKQNKKKNTVSYYLELTKFVGLSVTSLDVLSRTIRHFTGTTGPPTKPKPTPLLFLERVDIERVFMINERWFWLPRITKVSGSNSAAWSWQVGFVLAVPAPGVPSKRMGNF